MRSPSLLCPTTSLSWKVWALLAATVGLANAVTFNSVSQPSFNLDDLGRVALAGDFSGISLYEYEGQTGGSPLTNGSQSLMVRLPNGLFTTLVSADASIETLCAIEIDGSSVVVVGGNFTSLGNVEASGIALLNPTDGSVQAVDGLSGKVNALLCDQDTNRVYVGGEFSASNSTNALAWNGSNWVDLPFQGFDKAVKAIAKSANNTIIFGGSFSSLANSTTTPNVQFSQTLNLVSSNVTAEQTTDLEGFNDPTSIICSNGTDAQWLLEDGQSGSWTANFGFEFTPTKLRLRNANYEGRGTRLFRFRAFPIGGIMNLTYTDPDTNQQSYCDAWCPLGNSTGNQDFEFVNDVGMNSFRIDLLGYYGDGAGLAGIDIFQDDIYSFAVPDFNEPACAASTSNSNSTVTGNWSQTSSTDVDSDYLSINLSTSELSSASVVFEPHIPQSGQYRVLLYTPGCIQDNTCSTRGEINVTGTYTADGPPRATPVQLFQTNYYDKYDVIWNGQVDVASNGFRPRVTLAPTLTQSLDVVNIVAQKVRFELISANNGTSVNGSSSSTTNSTELNGLFEYDPTDTEISESDIENSVISSAGLQLASDAQVNSLIVLNSLTYVAGNFSASDNSFQNFFAVNDQGPVALAEGGLNGAVKTMVVVDSTIYLGGQFTATSSGSTSGLNFIAAYDVDGSSWSALGGGVNGVVKDIVPISLNLTSDVETVLAVTGDFDTINTDSDDSSTVSVEGFAIWIPSQSTWLERAPAESITIAGVLSASVDVSNGDTIYAGSLSSDLVSASGAVTVTSDTQTVLRALPLEFVDTNATGSIQRRAVVEPDFQGIYTGVFYESGSQNKTIIGGHFTAQGQDSIVYNLAFIDGASDDAVSGLGANDISSSSTVLALRIIDSLLFVGGSLEGNVSSNSVSGIFIWDLSSMDFADQQPPGLESAAGVEVHSITQRPDTNEVYVAGAFDSAGSFTCPAICVFDNSQKQWGTPGGDISGVVSSTYWVDANTLIVAGNMTINSTAETYMALYDARNAQFDAYPADTSNIPGPVTSIAMDSSGTNSLFIAGVSTNGTAYIMKLRNGAFVDLGSEFGSTSRIRNIQVMRTSTNHAASDVLREDLVLLVTGSLRMVGFGNASAAIYDGSTWTPFLFTSLEDGTPGSIAQIFSQREQNFTTEGSRLARGFVILISLAIALALVFLIVVLGVLGSYISRRREGYVPAPTSMSGIEKSTSIQDRLPPASLFSSVGPNQGRVVPAL